MPECTDANVATEGGVPWRMSDYRITVRHGGGPVRYHTYTVTAADVGAALRVAADELPDDVRETGDLVEIRRAPDPDTREYLE